MVYVVPYNFRLFDSGSKIDNEISNFKRCFFQKDVLDESHFLNLRTAFFTTYKEQSKKEDMVKTYFACLQSLIYLASHMRMPYRIEEKNLSILCKKLYDERSRNGEEIWIDEKEGINIFHVLARSQVDNNDFFYDCASIFNDDLASMLCHQDKHGFTPLNTACKEKEKINIVNAILCEAKIALSSEDFQTLLHQENKDGYTPFMSAHHSLPLLKALAEKINTLDLKKQTKKGNTVLTLACLCKNHETIDYLLEKAEQEGKDTLLYLLHHYNNKHENVLDIALRKKNYTALDTILDYASRYMGSKELLEYSISIIKGRDSKAMTILLYQANKNLSDFKEFIHESTFIPSFDLLQFWSNAPRIHQRLQRYLQTEPEAESAFGGADGQKECDIDMDAAPVANLS